MVYRRTKNYEQQASRRQEVHKEEMSMDVKECAAFLAKREKNAGWVYLGIAFLQILIGVLLLPTAAIVGILNLFSCSANFRRAKEVCDPYPGMVSEYYNQKRTLIINLVINTIFGGIVGAIPVIYDMKTRQYVMEHEDLFLKAEAEY